MKKTLVLLVCLALGLEAQTTIQIKRGNASVRPTLNIGELGLDRDSLDVWIGSDSGNVLIGGRSVVYGKATFAKDAGSTDAYAITLIPAPTKYWQGMRIAFRANTINTGTATLNVNSLGAKTIYKGPLVSDTLVTGDISTAGQLVEVVFADTAFFSLPLAAANNSVKLVFAPFYNDVATGNGWIGADSAISFSPFTVSESFTPDSAGLYLLSTLTAAAADSLRFAIYSYSGTLQCETGWKKTSGTSAQILIAPFSTHPKLPPGNYICAYSHVRWGVTGMPTTNIVSQTNTQFYLMATGAGGTRRVGSITGTSPSSGFPSTLSGAGVISAGTNVPVITLIGQ